MLNGQKRSGPFLGEKDGFFGFTLKAVFGEKDGFFGFTLKAVFGEKDSFFWL
jgi:hypothetical protein